MRNEFITFLLSYKRKTIDVEELEKVAYRRKYPYETFASLIRELEQEGILTMVKAKGRTVKQPSLAYTYRIQTAMLKEEHFKQIQRARLTLHEEIQLDKYFSLIPHQFETDLPYLEKISTYLETYGLPSEEVPAPERSFALVGDEKWLTDHGGEDCLKRVGLWEKMRIIPIADPLMSAVDGQKAFQEHHAHLIVENKTTYQALLPVLRDSSFTSLTLGYGRKIVKGIEHFHHQLLLDGEHTFYYFGDLDAEGIAIWYSLTERAPVKLALPFYRECLRHPSVFGKVNQRVNEQALQAFLTHFSKDEQEIIQGMLDRKHYLPQEVLRTKELQAIWRNWRE